MKHHHRMHQAVVAAALLLVAPPSLSATPIPDSFFMAPDAVLVHEVSAAAFPLHSGSYSRTRAVQYDDDGHDVSVSYASIKPYSVQLTVYVYPATEDVRTHGVTSSRAVQESRPGIHVAHEDFNGGVWQSIYSFRDMYQGENRPLFSLLVVTEHLGWFVKLRATFPWPQDHDARPETLSTILSEIPVFFPNEQRM